MRELIEQARAAAADLNALGAVRPEHSERFASLRVTLDQLAEGADQAAPAADPLDQQLHTLTTLVEGMSAEVLAIAGKLGV